jgi:hypothetical protein
VISSSRNYSTVTLDTSAILYFAVERPAPTVSALSATTEIHWTQQHTTSGWCGQGKVGFTPSGNRNPIPSRHSKYKPADLSSLKRKKVHDGLNNVLGIAQENSRKKQCPLLHRWKGGLPICSNKTMKRQFISVKQNTSCFYVIVRVNHWQLWIISSNFIQPPVTIHNNRIIHFLRNILVYAFLPSLPSVFAKCLSRLVTLSKIISVKPFQ